jgi:hypothetical protein
MSEYRLYDRLVILSIICVICITASHASAEQVEISARVPGCGDGVVEIAYGEQCDGANMDGQSCQGLGYTAGVLTCTASCSLSAALCTGSGSSSSGSSSGGYWGSSGTVQGWGAQDTTKTLDTLFAKVLARDGFVVFSGRGRPGTWVSVYNQYRYIASVQVEKKGDFTLSAPSPRTGEYQFTVFSVDTDGDVLARVVVSSYISQELVTQFSNISFDYTRPYQRPAGEIVGRPFVPDKIIPKPVRQLPLIDPQAIYRQSTPEVDTLVTPVVRSDALSPLPLIVRPFDPRVSESESVVVPRTRTSSPSIESEDTDVDGSQSRASDTEPSRALTRIIKLWQRVVGWVRALVVSDTRQ